MGLSAKAKSWRRQYLRRAAVEGLLRLAGAAFFSLVLLIWLDRAFALARAARWSLAAAGALALMWGVYRLLLRPWTGFRWDAVLDRAAALHPELKDYLKTAWELSFGGSPNTSESLRRAHLERTDALLASTPEVPLFSWKPSKAARNSVLAAMLGGFTMPWLTGSPSWERVLAPWRDVPLERFVAIAPGDANVEWGSAVKLAARFDGGAPAGRDRRELKLWLDGGDGWKAARWDSFTESGGDYNVEELSRPLRYRLTWRDLESRTYALAPVSLPELDALQALIHGPEPVAAALTAAEPLSVLRGTMITISGRPNQPLASARIKLSTLPAPITMKLQPSGEYAASLVVQEDALLRFELEATDGRDNTGSAYSIKALPDMPPKIELLSPLEPLAASPRDTIAVSYSAADDGGLTKISLLVRAKGMPQREILLQKPGGKREVAGEFPWELAGLPFGHVEFQLKAVDNASVPQTGLSSAGTVELVDFAAGHEQAEKSWSKAEESLKTLAALEERARTQITQPDPATVDRESSELSKSWDEAAEDYLQWSRAMEKDAYANPGLAEAAKAEAQSLEESRGKELPEALKAAKAGDNAAAQRRHETLAARVKQAQRLLSEGRKLQGLQDFYSEAGRMNQSGSDLQSKLDSLAQKGAADPQAMAELKAGLEKLQKQMDELSKAMQAMPKVDANSPEAKSRQTYELPLNEARSQADELASAMARGDLKAAAEIAKRLSESLAKIQRALGDAASDSAANGQARQASERMSKAQAMWSDLIDQQTKVLEQTETLERKRIDAKVAAQKNLLAELAKRQAELVSSASGLGALFPQDALGMMRSVSEELDSKRVVNSISWLRGAAARLRMEPPKPGANFASYAAAEDDIREKLAQGPAMPDEAPTPESAAVAASQASVRANARALQAELESIDADTGGVPGEALEKISGAQDEQSKAETELGRGRGTEAKGHEESALSLLSSGSQAMGKAMDGSQAMQNGMGRPFSRPTTGAFRMISGGSGGGSGAQMTFVPLPSDKEYAPPRELRDELKKSLEESRPSTYDGVIKEYFKRISQ